MKIKNYIWVGTTALAVFLAVPQMASAQIRGSYVQSSSGVPVSQTGTVNRTNNQSNLGVRPEPSFVPMRSGAIERGSRPNFFSNSNNSNNFGSVYGGGNGFSGNYAPGNGQGPIVIIPEAPEQFHRPGYSWTNEPGQSYTESNYPRPNYLPPVGPGNGFFNNLTPPVGPANGFFNNSTPPVGPANGFGQTAPERRHRSGWDGGNNYVYDQPSYQVIINAPPLLGGYYYGGYCENYAPVDTYPSVYSGYSGFPQYIYSPGTIVIEQQPYAPVYATPYLPFYAPTYQTVYNENTYYVGSESRVQELEAGGDKAKAALQNAYAANSFQAAFADIAQAWTDSDITLLRRHLRDKDTRISVSLNKKYSYSIASGDFSGITRDALDRLHTVSFEFTHLRKAKNGDVTAYGTHVYRVASSAEAGDGKTVPFDQSGTASSVSSNALLYDKTNDPSNGAEKTVYVSYTLRRHDGEWYITATDSADHDLADATAK